jgi:hypothetical protein
MTSSIRDRRHLHDLIERLDAASETLELLGFSGPDASGLSLSLRDSFEVRFAIKEAANFLAEIKLCGGQP